MTLASFCYRSEPLEFGFSFVALTPTCNRSKHAKTLSEWRPEGKAQ